MAAYRNIDYAKLLYESLRGYFSINVSNNLSWLYQYCYALLQPLQLPFNNYAAFRQLQDLIANCKWQVGQLTNVLNMIYDPTLKRIYITQSVAISEYVWQFPYPPSMFLGQFGAAPSQFLQQFNEKQRTTIVTINVPASINLSSITAVIAQISITGIPYQIIQF